MAKKVQQSLIIRPIITEKSMKLVEEQNQYTFEIARKISKERIAKEIERLFNVKVMKIRTTTLPGKKVQWGRNRIPGRKRDTRKAVVTLKSSDSIDLFKVS
jgi:large subunit ribosomal protein L23